MCMCLVYTSIKSKPEKRNENKHWKSIEWRNIKLKFTESTQKREKENKKCKHSRESFIHQYWNNVVGVHQQWNIELKEEKKYLYFLYSQFSKLLF